MVAAGFPQQVLKVLHVSPCAPDKRTAHVLLMLFELPLKVNEGHRFAQVSK